MNILLVEDDPQLSRDVGRYLSKAGYGVEYLERGDWAARYLPEHQDVIGCVVLDLGLPYLSGLEVLAGWRRQGISTPVLILTARNSWQERVDGLNAGADDYLGKPFQSEELLARLEALRRRVEQQGQIQLVVDGLILDETKQQVSDGAGMCASLTATEFAMLRLLMQKAGQIVSKQQLLDTTYDWQEEKNENLVEVYIRRLRKKIGQQRIHTYRGQGYLMGKR
ncbi:MULTISPECIES: response regulator transcription factor [unclassified Oceanobacter]|uniref:response regulator transcription factor n=1 Tax=unclassified Oceanobacter TaxID=2620260 RepID=UPI0026E1807D|nr:MULTISPECIES: response regulator transcription factor [unclassified Oceanobacter]MDO6682305.1 response regulator transcription factor [Oceanobacter sp. 5_MG-2023]MDP2506059.1 response regulator transcription factor [Oceanobacter sp. 3_MG-2023]